MGMCVMNYSKIFITGVIGVFVFTTSLYAAVGCTLNDPDRDIRRIFPQSTNYQTEFISINDRGGNSLAREIEEKLGDKLEPVYETLDVPYAYYVILQGKEVIGYVHGVNQKGTFGGMQLIVATDIEGVIIDFYYQKMSSPESKKFRDKKFTEQFIGLTLCDFDEGDLSIEITDPSEDSANDYDATIRGLKKNLILVDVFGVNTQMNDVKE